MQKTWVFETTYITDTSPFAIPADVSCIQTAKANSFCFQKVHLFSMTFPDKFITFIQCVFSITEKTYSVCRSLTVAFYLWHSSDSGSETASGF